MATALCVASTAEDVQRGIPNIYKTPWVEPNNCEYFNLYPRSPKADWRTRTCMHPHTARTQCVSNLTPSHRGQCATPKQQPCSEHLYTHVRALVSTLLDSLAPAYGSEPPLDKPTFDLSSPHESVAYALLSTYASAPPRPQKVVIDQRESSGLLTGMDFNVDFGDASGIQTRGKKAAAKKKAQTFSWGDDDNGGEGQTNGEGGDGTGDGAGGGDSGTGGAGDDGNGEDQGDDDAWGFGSSKKDAKKKKKKQEEEEEQKAKEEAEAAAATTGTLNWADDANENLDDDWTSGFTTAKDKKKKKKGADILPAVPEPPPAPSFQDISLDDPAPKLEFSFGGGQKKDSASFGTWGNTWDFNGTDTKTDAKGSKKDKDKKEEPTLGDNNPWGATTKKKKAGFDFGDLGSSNNNDYSFDGDLGGTKTTDDAWGFAGKKDKKKVEEKKDDAFNLDSKDDTSWATGGWGSKTTKKKTGFLEEVEEKKDDTLDLNGDSGFDWGFGSKESKKKNLISALDETKPADSAWGSAGKKTTKKTAAEPAPDPPAADDDIWSFGKKDKKSKTIDPVVETTAAPEMEDDPDWDLGLSPKERRKKEKDLRAAGHFPPQREKIVSTEPEPLIEPVEPEMEDDPDWDFGLSPKEKRKLEKELRAAGNFPPQREKKAPTEPEPVIDLVQPEMEDDPDWDLGLSPKERRTREKELRAAGNFPPQREKKVLADPEPEPVIDPVGAEMEEDLDWALGLNAKDKKKRQLELKAEGNWPPMKPKVEEPTSVPEEPAVEMVEDPDWDAGLSPKERRAKEKQLRADDQWPPMKPKETEQPIQEQPSADMVEDPDWDAGLSPKERKAREKQLRADGDWPPMKVKEPEPTIPEEPAVEMVEDLDWDAGLSPKERRAREKQLRADGQWPAMKPKEPEVLQAVPDPPQEPAVELVEDLDWDIGLLPKEKRKREKELRAEGNWPPMKPKPAPIMVEDLDWDAGLSPKERRAREKQLRADDQWPPMKEAEAKVEAPIVEEEELLGSWGFGDSKKKAAAKETKAVEEDIWDSFAKPSSKSKKKEPPPPAPTPPAQGLTPEPTIDEDDTWGAFSSAKTKKKDTVTKTTSKESSKSKVEEETPAKAVKSMWGFGAATATSKVLTKKEKDAKTKQEEDDRIAREAEEAAEAERLQAEKDAKKSKTGKLTKTTSKSSSTKKAEEDALIDILGDPTPKSKSSKLTKEKVEDKKDDYFGSWGSTSTGKKTTPGQTKKEIASRDAANHANPLDDSGNDLDFGFDDKFPSSSKSTKAMTGDKLKTSSSVKDRIKQLEINKKEDAGKKGKVDALTKELEEDALSPKVDKKEKASATSKLKAKSDNLKTSSSSKKVSASSPPVEEKTSKDSVPGSFPGAFGDDDTMDFSAPNSPVKTKKTTKDTKTTKTKTKTKVEAEPLFEAPEPPKLPTPPPEDKRSSRKERPRVERSATSSWGFWGAAPAPAKKAGRSKDDSDVSPPPKAKPAKSPPPLKRSMSMKSSKEKERDEQKEADKQSKSSGSEKDASSKKDRPKAARGFSNFMFGGPPPSAMKTRPSTTRRSSADGGSRASSRRRSDPALMSPPPDSDVDMTDKAAKLMGVKSDKVSRKASVKKSKVPDPYPIDDDDMVMINTPEATPVKTKAKVKTSKKEEVGTSPIERPSWSPNFKKEVSADGKTSFKQKPKKSSAHDDDVVMVDTPGDPLVTSGPDDIAFVDHASPLKRSNTAKKAAGFFGSFFGGGKNVEETRARSSTLTDGEDALPIRTKSSRHKSRIVDDGHTTTDAPHETDADVDARRADRRAKRDARDKAEEDERTAREDRRKERREREKADLEARRSKTRDRERKDREDEDARREEKRSRRAAKESSARHADDETGGPQTDAEKRKEERRKLREKLAAESGADPVTSKEDRKQAFEAEESARRERRKDEKRTSKHGASSKHRDSRRASVLAEEYHNSRSSSKKTGHLNHVPDSGKTGSWVDSLHEDPPDMPPVAETVLDPAGERPRAPDGGNSSKKDKYAGMTEEEARRERKKARKAREIEKEKNSASGGSDERRKTRHYMSGGRGEEDENYPVMSFDGRPEMKRTESKRKSFLGGLF